MALCISKIRDVLSIYAGVHIPASEEQGLSVYLHPNEALIKGSSQAVTLFPEGERGADGDDGVDGSATVSSLLPAPLSASLSATARSLSQLPSSAPLDPGASWAAAHQLPTPLGPLRKPIEDWSVHDVQVSINANVWKAGCTSSHLPASNLSAFEFLGEVEGESNCVS